MEPPLFMYLASRFDLHSFSDAQIRSRFRFHSAADIIRLAAGLGLPAEMRLANGSVIDGVSALCITLRRLAYPCRLEELEPTFGRNREVLSMCVKETMELIYDRHKSKLHDLDHPWMQVLTYSCVLTFNKLLIKDINHSGEW